MKVWILYARVASRGHNKFDKLGRILESMPIITEADARAANNIIQKYERKFPRRKFISITEEV